MAFSSEFSELTDQTYSPDTTRDGNLIVSTFSRELLQFTTAEEWAAAIGSGGVPTTITVASEATDTTCFPLFVTAATGDLGPKTNDGLTFNSSTGALSATIFVGAIDGTAISTGIVGELFGGTGVSNSYTISVGGIFSTAAAFSTGDTFSTTGTFSSGGDFYTQGTFYTSDNFFTGAQFYAGGAVDLSAGLQTTGTSGISLAAPSTGSPITYTLPTTAATLARTDAAQTFTGTNTMGASSGQGISLHGGGSITGASGAITISASGANQNVTVSPIGSGVFSILGGSTMYSGASLISIGGDSSGYYVTPNNASGGMGLLGGNSGNLRLLAGAAFGWVSSTSSVYSSAPDTTITRVSAGVVGLPSATIGGGTAIAKSATYTAAMSASVSATSIGTVTVTATGVAAGDTFAIEVPQQTAGIVLAGVRGGTDQILVDFYNTTGGSISLTGTVKLRSFEV